MRSLRIKNPATLSVALHLAVFAVWFICLARSPNVAAPVRTTTYIELEPLPTVADIKKKTENDSDTRIVKTEQGKLTQEAAPDAFRSDRTQVVDRQTVTETNISGSPARVAAAKPEIARAAPAETAPKAAVTPDLSAIPLAKLGVAMPTAGLKPGEQAREFANQDEAEQHSPAEQVQGGEYVKGFDKGQKSMLNTKEFVFYGYFERIRSSLDRAWSKTLRAQLAQYFNKGRSLASDQDYLTQVLVTLDSDGQVKRVQVVGASGTRDLDDAGVKAFNAAGPFPNPPKGLVDSSGQIAIRWDFILRT